MENSVNIKFLSLIQERLDTNLTQRNQYKM